MEDKFAVFFVGEHGSLIKIVISTAVEGAIIVSYADEVWSLFKSSRSEELKDWNDMRNQVMDNFYQDHLFLTSQ